jgi:hypothetical protein
MKSATRVSVSVFGVIIGLAGLEHGIGEILQGNKSPEGIWIASWPEAEFFRIQAGEPALTLIPNLLISGILSSIFSLIYLITATRYAHRKQGALALLGLATVMLAVGGGLFPPVLGLITGWIATRINHPIRVKHSRIMLGLQDFFRKLWPGSVVFSVGAFLAMLPGLNILDYFFGYYNESLMFILMLVAVGSLLLVMLNGLMVDMMVEKPRERAALGTA